VKTSAALYEVRLLRKFVAAARSNHPVVYPEGSEQYAWQDRHGFLWLRGKTTGWEFSTCSKPGVDFVWLDGVDPRKPSEMAIAREVPAAVGYGEDGFKSAKVEHQEWMKTISELRERERR
jgi:hypothetical protein